MMDNNYGLWGEVYMIRVAWIGFHEEGIKAFRKIVNSKYTVCGFITLEDLAFAKRSAGSREYEDICIKNNIPYYTVDTIKGDVAYEILKNLNPDLVVVLGWSEIIPERLLSIPTIGTIGTHAALLPHNRGSAPINWALIHGEKVTGNTMMWLDPQVDAGKIIDQISFDITPYDTCKSLYDKVADTNAEMLIKLLDNLERGIKPESDIENITDEPILPRRRPKDGLLDWNQSGEAVYNFIRAITDPYPGAFTFLNGQKWLVWKASLLPICSAEPPGTILGISYGFSDNSCGYLVSTKDNVIMITEIESDCRYSGESLNKLNLKGQMKNE